MSCVLRVTDFASWLSDCHWSKMSFGGSSISKDGITNHTHTQAPTSKQQYIY